MNSLRAMLTLQPGFGDEVDPHFRLRRLLIFAFLLAAVLLAPRTAAAGGELDVWVRAPGQYANGNGPERSKNMVFNLDRFPSTDVTLVDFQYGRSERFMVVRLKQVLARYPLPNNIDLALLTFSNGMRVPVAITDLLSDEAPLVAIRVWSPERRRWTDQFPPVTSPGAFQEDARPIRFSANKVVVKSGGQALEGSSAWRGFSPWKHVDTLVGIELVRGHAYYGQFNVGGDYKTEEGFRLYEQSCQFCHGVRDVGASFGWDFIDPVAVTEYRSTPKSLYYHVHYRVSDAAQRGILMPALKHMTRDDASNLWLWLDRISHRRLRPYTP